MGEVEAQLGCWTCLKGFEFKSQNHHAAIKLRYIQIYNNYQEQTDVGA